MKKTIFILTLILLLFGCSKKEKVEGINLIDYIMVYTEGNEKTAIAKIEFDNKSFKKTALSYKADSKDIDYYLETLKLEVSPNTNLKNKDKITITITEDQVAKENLKINTYYDSNMLTLIVTGLH